MKEKKKEREKKKEIFLAWLYKIIFKLYEIYWMLCISPQGILLVALSSSYLEKANGKQTPYVTERDVLHFIVPLFANLQARYLYLSYIYIYMYCRLYSIYMYCTLYSIYIFIRYNKMNTLYLYLKYTTMNKYITYLYT